MLHQACVSMRKHHRFRGLHGKVGALVGFGDSAFRNISWVSLFWDGNLPAGVAQSGALGNGAWKGWKSKIIPGKCRAEVQHSQMPQLVLGELGLKYWGKKSSPCHPHINDCHRTWTAVAGKDVAAMQRGDGEEICGRHRHRWTFRSCLGVSGFVLSVDL